MYQNQIKFSYCIETMEVSYVEAARKNAPSMKSIKSVENRIGGYVVVFIYIHIIWYIYYKYYIL